MLLIYGWWVATVVGSFQLAISINLWDECSVNWWQVCHHKVSSPRRGCARCLQNSLVVCVFFFAFSVKVAQYRMLGSCKREKKRLILEANVESVKINCSSFVLSALMKERGFSSPWSGVLWAGCWRGSFLWISLQIASRDINPHIVKICL